jgi:hypothetical protein
VRFPVFTLLAVAIVVLVIGLDRCGGEEDGGEEATTPATTTAAPEPEPGEGEPGGDREGATPATDGPATASPGLSDPELAEAALLQVLAGADPRRVCDRAVTERFLREAYGGREGCLNGRDPASLARPGATRIGEPRIEGDRAELSARPAGGTYGGERLDAVVVRTPEGWRVDELSADIPVGP